MKYRLKPQNRLNIVHSNQAILSEVCKLSHQANSWQKLPARKKKDGANMRPKVFDAIVQSAVNS